MAFKPKSNLPQNTGERKEFVPIVPDDGVQAVHIGLMVNLGQHAKYPKFAKDSAGKREVDENGNDKIIIPKEGSEEQKVAVYVDLLTQTHDYGEEIGVRNIRIPLHQVSRGMSEGINFTTIAPRDKDGNYIKGKPWIVPPASAWYKIASVTKDDEGKSIKDIIFEANYKNQYLNDIELLIGRPFMYNVEVDKTEKGDKTYVNVKLKNAVPLIKGMPVPEAVTQTMSINFDDEDLLEEKYEGKAKIDFIRIADLRKIVLAKDYEGSKMQEAVRDRHDEKELIKQAKEIEAKLIETDKELQEIYSIIGKDGDNSVDSGSNEPAPAKADKPVAKKVTKTKEEVPTDDSEAPF